MKLKYLVAAAATLASTQAFAELTGNVSAVSEYMFRGISQGEGPAVQGGVDYKHDSGLYVGAWGSNVDWGAGDTEVDLYGGYANTFGDSGLGYDLGAIFYWYPEAGEETSSDPNTVEYYLNLSYSYFSAGVAYTDDYYDTDEAFYYNLAATLPVTESISLALSAGLSDGDGIKETFGEDNYMDYSVVLSKAVTDAFSVSFSFVQTDLDEDDAKFLIGAAYTFDM